MGNPRVAIIGAGPAGFYAAERLLKDPTTKVEVELFDRLPTPWGLVRAGVAPDHPKIKSVSRVYEKTAALAGFRFHGNVVVGSDLTPNELLAHHHAVIYSYGAAQDRRLGIPGEELAGCVPATEFVAWYNGHPDAVDLELDLDGRRAVVVGNGNVALDVARMLVLTSDELAITDIANQALLTLTTSSIEEVVVLGRRGPAQAAYTTPELRELGELTDADVTVDPADVQLDTPNRGWLQNHPTDRTIRGNVEIVSEYAGRKPAGRRRRVVLRFLSSPVEILGAERVDGMRVVRNELIADETGRIRAQHTDVEEIIECDLVLRAVGYRGAGIEGVPFDERSGTIPNQRGRVLAEPGGTVLPGVYAAGWIKRGPSGVIGTNKKCAHETVEHLLEDLASGRLPEPNCSRDELDGLLAERTPQRVDYAGWKRIDMHERRTGEAQGRPRVKLTSRGELLAHALIDNPTKETNNAPVPCRRRSR
jgi:ferredoxin--NADP+ reductase